MKIKTTVWAKKESWQTEYQYSLHDWDVSDSGYICVEEVEIEFGELTREELVVGHIAALRATRKRVLLAAQDKVHDIEEEISKLLAISDGS